MKKIMIWGTGNTAKSCIANIDHGYCTIVAFIESVPQKNLFNNIEVISPDKIKGRVFDFIVIASQFENEIIDRMMELNINLDHVASWIKIKNNIYRYPREIADLFAKAFRDIFFLEKNTDTAGVCVKNDKFIKKLEKYNKIYVYNLDISQGEIAFYSLIEEVLNCMAKKQTGMVFIPSKSNKEEWYERLLGVLCQYACVPGEEDEPAFFYYIKKYCDRVSFEKFDLFLSESNFKRVVDRSIYWKYSQKRTETELERIDASYESISFYGLWNTRIGEFIRNVTYVSVQEQKEKELNVYIPFNQGKQITFEGANSCFTDLVGRVLYLVNDKNEYYFWIKKIFQNPGKYRFGGKVLPYDDVKELEAFPKKPYVDFSQDEQEYGKEIIKRRLGVEQPYVCILLRDPQYLNATHPAIDHSYHNYRDNVSMDTLKKALTYFGENKLSAVRVGQITGSKSGMDDLCLDFPNTGYDEFMDMMLHRNCKFLLCNDTGGMFISTFLGKPIAVLDTSFPYFDVYLPDMSDSIGIFNLLLSTRENRLLTFRETFEASRSFKLYRNKGETKVFYEENGLMQIPYTPEDVLELAREMNERVDGRWKDTEEDTALRNKFQAELDEFLRKYEIDNFVYPQHLIATTFLRKNKHLI